MPTDRELKVLLRPLLERRPDLAYDRRVLFFSPLTHYLRGVVFISSMNGAKRFSVVSFVTQLFSGHHTLNFGGSTDQHSREVPNSWADKKEEAMLALCEHIERYSLPIVEPAVEPSEHEKLPAYMPGYLPGAPLFESPAYSFAVALGACFVGDFGRAERVLGNILVHFPQYAVGSATEEYRFHESFFWREAYLLRLLRTDRTRIPPLLHEWEAFRVDSLKLKKYWRPTPFPCETAVSEASPAGIKPSHSN